MKRQVRPLSVAEWRKQFPEEGQVPGWRFRVVETSPGAYRVDGGDRFGRQVSHRGEDPQRMLDECQDDARDIQRQVAVFPDTQALYDSVALLCRDLERADWPQLGRRIRDVMAGGCTAGEVLGGIRAELLDVQAEPTLDEALRQRIVPIVSAIDQALGGPGRA